MLHYLMPNLRPNNDEFSPFDFLYSFDRQLPL